MWVYATGSVTPSPLYLFGRALSSLRSTAKRSNEKGLLRSGSPDARVDAAWLLYDDSMQGRLNSGGSKDGSCGA
jgi:hypothetical protein